MGRWEGGEAEMQRIDFWAERWRRKWWRRGGGDDVLKNVFSLQSFQRSLLLLQRGSKWRIEETYDANCDARGHTAD